MAKELKLMKGNEAIARAMIASGTTATSAIPSLRNRKLWKL